MNRTGLAADQRRVIKSRDLIHRRRLLREIIIVTVMLFVIVFLGVQLLSAHQQKVQLHRQATVERTELVRERSERRALVTNVKQLKNNGYLEQLIRQKYYYTKPGETIYNLPGDEAKDVTHD